ncbi:MAG TPA: putative toxin-antitoxin system toxin component, PIN family [Acidiferrobacterales bacterium]|nr:putative toxin-antitoxin system toxin component, PIN family [Acidiferrobacterales bacterium]
MRVVLDTGILIAALITAGTPPDQIYQAWRKKRFQLITSEWQLDEFRRASRYDKLKQFIKPAEAGNLVNGLKHQALVLKALPRVDLSRDPEDNPLLAMAVAGRADYLVTGDRRGLLTLKKVDSTRIVTAREFLKVLLRRK